MEVIGGGDYNSDGTDDYIIAAPQSSEDFGRVFLLDGTQLDEADKADGVTDGVIDVAEIPGLANSYFWEPRPSETRSTAPSAGPPISEAS
jgi:hypothetical protein